VSDAYVGTELALFAEARHWKNYVARLIAPFLGPRVLEVGAGLGSNIPHLWRPAVTEWLALEPDPGMAQRLREKIARGELPANCRAVAGDIRAAGETPFDAILYLDVLEHIADDHAELIAAGRRLAPHGRLIVLAPAHQFLFSPFDAAIGHHRRYSAATLRRAAPPELRLLSCRMLDSVGLFASLANRLVLRSALPTAREIAFWDRVLVPLSRIADPATFHRFGKSVLAVWAAAP
jgi:SAM-dependent methyltransferase